MLQRAAEEVQPFGENRADMRMAACISTLIQYVQPELSERAVKSIAQDMRNYLEFNQPAPDRTRTPAEAEEIKRRYRQEGT